MVSFSSIALYIFMCGVIALNGLFYYENFDILILMCLQSVIYILVVGSKHLLIPRLYCTLIVFVIYYLIEQIRDAVCYNLRDSTQKLPCNLFFIFILFILVVVDLSFLFFIERHLRLKKSNNGVKML